MRFVTFRGAGGPAQAGVVRNHAVTGLGTDLLSIISGGEDGLRDARERATRGDPVPLDSVKLLAPLPRPPKLICVGLNYLDHARESKMEVPSVPTIFSKFSNAVIAPGENIVLPKNSTKPDYEAEFAFIIGKAGRHIPEERWREHVFGYTIVNDVSARDFQMATSQWLMGKTFDTFAPMGPHIVTADEISDPHSLDIRMTINGEVLQDSNTRELIFKIPALIAYLSSVFTLEPGDVVSTGTPAGVGAGRKPPRWLQAGDECVVSVQGLGELRNPVVAE
jgi:2-keto-4-pentenoate hydratase/2-oxohepta-3-ene-1,7-dioic acid hydratase in catechol pathway